MNKLEEKKIYKNSKEDCFLKVFIRVKSSSPYYSSPTVIAPPSERQQYLNCNKKDNEEICIADSPLGNTHSFVSVVDNQTVRLEPVQHVQNCNCEMCFKSYGSALSRSISKSYSIDNASINRSCSLDSSTKKKTTASTPGKDYRFNRVFLDSDNATDIYNYVKADVFSIFEGYSCTVFTHGPPGSGKSSTMFGEGGLAEEVVKDLIALTGDRAAPTHLEMSFIELHNNAFRNLFSRKSSIQQNNDKKKMMTGMSTLTWSYAERIDSPADCIFNSSGSNLVQIPVDSAAQALAAIAAARKRITPSYTATTAISSPSSASASASPGTSATASYAATSSAHSKSHVILTFHVESQSSDPNLSSDEVEYKQGKLHLVDLASEVRVTSKSSARDSTESAAINLSLHTLGKVLKGLAANCNSTAATQSRPNLMHVPFLDSKLTALLREPLTKGRTIMIACLAQVRVPYALAEVRHEAYKQAAGCLELAHIAGRIRTAAIRNIRKVKGHRLRWGRFSRHSLSQSDDLDDEKTTVLRHYRHSLQLLVPSSMSQELDKPAAAYLVREESDPQPEISEEKNAPRRTSSSPGRRHSYDQLLADFQQMERRSQEEQRLLKTARHRYEGLLHELEHWGYTDLPLKIDILQSCVSASCSADTATTSARAGSGPSVASVTYEDVYGPSSDNTSHSQSNSRSCLFEDSVVTDATNAIAKRLNGHSSAMQVKRSIDQQAKLARQLCETTRNCVLRYKQAERSDSSEVASPSTSADNNQKYEICAEPTHASFPVDSQRRKDEVALSSSCGPESALPASPSDSRLQEMSSEARRANRAVHVMSFARRCTEAAAAQLAITIIEIANEQLRLQKQRCVLLREERDGLAAQVADATAAIATYDNIDSDSISHIRNKREVDDLDEAGQENDFNRCNSQNLSCSFSADGIGDPPKMGFGSQKEDKIESLQSTGSFDVLDDQNSLSAKALSCEIEKIDAALDREKLQRLREDRANAEQQADLLRGLGAEEEQKESNPAIAHSPRERARKLRLAWMHLKKEEEASSTCVTLLQQELDELKLQEKKRLRRQKLQERVFAKARSHKKSIKSNINSNSPSLKAGGLLVPSYSNCAVLPPLPEHEENIVGSDAKSLTMRRLNSESITCGFFQQNFTGDDFCYVVDQARSFSNSQDDSCGTVDRFGRSDRHHLFPEAMKPLANTMI